jgi:hypothetical protein
MSGGVDFQLGLLECHVADGDPEIPDGRYCVVMLRLTNGTPAAIRVSDLEQKLLIGDAKLEPSNDRVDMSDFLGRNGFDKALKPERWTPAYLWFLNVPNEAPVGLEVHGPGDAEGKVVTLQAVPVTHADD